jgi:hypothetical protein
MNEEMTREQAGPVILCEDQPVDNRQRTQNTNLVSVNQNAESCLRPMQTPDLLHKSQRCSRHGLKSRLQNIYLVNARVVYNCSFERYLFAHGTMAYGAKQRLSVTFADSFRISNAALK